MIRIFQHKNSEKTKPRYRPKPYIETISSRVSRHFPILLLLGFGSLLSFLFWLTWNITHPILMPGKAGNEYTLILGKMLTTAQASFYASVTAAIFTGVGFFAAVLGLSISIHDRRKERAHLMAAEWN
jgi:hypothetical protein